MRANTISLFLLAVLLLLPSCSGRKVSTVGSDPSVEARGEKLLSQMTLAEKIGQMNQISAGGAVSDYAEALRKGQIGLLADRYLMQMWYYRSALERLSGKKVKQAWLYSFRLGESVDLSSRLEALEKEEGWRL